MNEFVCFFEMSGNEENLRVTVINIFRQGQERHLGILSQYSMNHSYRLQATDNSHKEAIRRRESVPTVNVWIRWGQGDHDIVTADIWGRGVRLTVVSPTASNKISSQVKAPPTVKIHVFRICRCFETVKRAEKPSLLKILTEDLLSPVLWGQKARSDFI